jgi:hypothetical protein
MGVQWVRVGVTNTYLIRERGAVRSMLGKCRKYVGDGQYA